VIQDDAVYPLFLSLYQQNPAGNLRITNRENAEIRNVRVSFRAGSYTSSEYICGTAPFIGKNRRVEIPLSADFSPELLKFTENGRIVGEVIVRYSFLGKEQEAVRSAAVQVYNRNVFAAQGEVGNKGIDWSGLAAFVSPTTPEVLEFSKYITGIARTERRTGLNQNMQFGIWPFEGLKAYGLSLGNSKDSQYSLIEAQFPSQTLAYKSGTALDAGLLYAASLEAAGIGAAFIPLGDNFITAFSLGITEAQAETLFDGTDTILIVNDEVWIPLSMKDLNSGFGAAWAAAITALNTAFEREETIQFNIMEDCWSLYVPAPFPALDVRIVQPDIKTVSGGAAAAISGYIAGEIEPLVREAQLTAQSSPTAAAYNRLGLLQIRAGRAAEAKTAFEQAAGMGSVSAMTNRGNLALNEKDYTAAENWYRRALANQPDNATALRNLEQVTANK
jgi:tetratricopeptide (TPR) repeat protein